MTNKEINKLPLESKFSDDKRAHILHEGDAKNLLKIKDLHKKVRLIVTSPPYNIGKEYEEVKKLEDYLEDQIGIIKELINVMTDDGSLCWQVGNYVDKKTGHLVPLDIPFYNIFRENGLMLRNRIIWHFKHGYPNQKKLTNQYETILWFTKDENHYFDLDAIRVPQLYPGYRNPKGHKKEGQASGNPKGKNPGNIWDVVPQAENIWDVPQVKAKHLEKTDHPAQFPISIIRRLITALTEEGDYVLDPYVGSGTTIAAAALENRIGIGAEINKEYCEIVKNRIKDLNEGKMDYREDKEVPEPKGKVSETPNEWEDK